MSDAGTTDRDAIRNLYDERAAGYLADAIILQRYFGRLFAFVETWVKPGQRVLDLGCGPGFATAGLPPEVQVVGMDLSPGMLDVARRTRPGGEYLVHDFHQPIPGDLFDIIVASSCFDFCEDIERVIGHVGAALKPGGRAYFTVDELRPDLPAHQERRSPELRPGVRIHFWSFEETARAIAKAGLLPVSYDHGPGWFSRTSGLLVHYGYWHVAKPIARP